jgi:hypothetical protein
MNFHVVISTQWNQIRWRIVRVVFVHVMNIDTPIVPTNQASLIMIFEANQSMPFLSTTIEAGVVLPTSEMLV